jgi:hypothetical protein
MNANSPKAPERTVLQMVAELHVRGYQRLRIIPHFRSTGFWRCGITTVFDARPDHGACAVDSDERLLPQYSSAGARTLYDWKDADHATPSGLARRFIKRFPDLAAAGYCPDWLYAGWYIHMLHRTYGHGVPFAWWDDATGPTWFLCCSGSERRIPLPPPGLAVLNSLSNRTGGPDHRRGGRAGYLRVRERAPPHAGPRIARAHARPGVRP